ncbi:pectinesterase family protein [Lachnospiraceae bacterium 54-53]
MIHISQDGTGDFKSVGEALESLPKDNTAQQILYIHKGFYKERITAAVPFVTLVGEHGETTVLSYDLSAHMTMDDGSRRGTFRTASCLIDTHDFTARNITFENSAGKGTEVGQALALYADGDRLTFENCRFLGGQDTLFTGPLPPQEIEPNGFIGPKQFSPRINGRHYYKNCYLEGDVDFIFGGATAYFEGCTFFSKYTGKEISSYVTAASTPKGQKYGYVMKDCRFESSCPAENAYLGRPWREYAKTVLINCYMGDHICKEGWHDWNKKAAHEHTFYAEYGSFGPGGAMENRPDWIHRLTESDLTGYTKEAVLSGTDGWRP